jgi:endoglycosylceramidase
VTRHWLPWALALTASLFAGCDSGGTQLPAVCTLSLPSPPDWRLQADGTALRDGLGRVVFLRGVDAGGRSKLAPYVPFDYAPGQYAQALGAYMDRAASWGIDAMRVPFTWAALEPTQGQNDADWMSRYQQLLDAAWSRGIWTVVDFHQDVYSEAFCGDGFPSWTVPPNAPAHQCPNPDWSFEYFQDAAVQAAFDAFWASGSPVQAQYLSAWDVMAARFKDQPGVVGFEPINEPAWGTDSDIMKFEATTLSAFYTAVLPHFRAIAPQTLLFVDPTGFAGTAVSTGLTKPPGDGLVFAPHYYPVSNGNPNGVLDKMQGWGDVGTAWNVPVFVGEFGISHNNPNALDYMTAHFAALDALNASGTEWEYSVSVDPWNSETDGIVAGDGTEYDVAGAVIRPFARAVAGDGVSQSWDPVAGVFTLSYTPSPTASTSITEVQLPARAFSGGFSVQTVGGCFDATSAPGRLLVQAAGATPVSVRVTSTNPPASSADAGP